MLKQGKHTNQTRTYKILVGRIAQLSDMMHFSKGCHPP